MIWPHKKIKPLNYSRHLSSIAQLTNAALVLSHFCYFGVTPPITLMKIAQTNQRLGLYFCSSKFSCELRRGMGLLAGFGIVTTVYLTCAGLTLALPGRKVIGYACDTETGKPLQYRLNGLLVLYTTLAIFFVLGALKIVPRSFIASNFFSSAFAANTYGLIGSTLLYFRGKGLNPRQPYQVCA